LLRLLLPNDALI